MNTAWKKQGLQMFITGWTIATACFIAVNPDLIHFLAA